GPARVGEPGVAVRRLVPADHLRRGRAVGRSDGVRDRCRPRRAGAWNVCVPANGAGSGGDRVTPAGGEMVLENATRSFAVVHERARNLKELFVRGGGGKRSRVAALAEVSVRMASGEAVG